MDAEKATYEVARMARLLGVSRSGFYAWAQRQAAGPSSRQQRHEALLVRIKEFHQASDGVNGAPRITADLRADGEVVSTKTVARIMRRRHPGYQPPPVAPGDHVAGPGAAHDPGPGRAPLSTAAR